MEERGGINLYSFVRNNPISRYDISGNIDFENIGSSFGKADSRGFWMGASFSLQKGTAMSSKIGVTGSTTPCCGGATEPLSKPPLYQFTTYANLFDFGNYNNQGAWSNEQKRSMLHFSNGDFEHVGNKYYGELTITFEYQIVPATRAPSGWAINPVDHGPSSPDPPSGWKPDAKIEITCYWKCGEDGVICKQKPDNAISEDGRDRKGEDGLPRN